jgi:hypothetical protein
MLVTDVLGFAARRLTVPGGPSGRPRR